MHQRPGLPVHHIGHAAEPLEKVEVVDTLVEHLKTYEGLYEIESSANAGPEELELLIRPEAKALGITLADLARQGREAFYGAEAQRIQGGTQEVKVMVRYPRQERISIGNLENMWRFLLRDLRTRFYRGEKSIPEEELLLLRVWGLMVIL